MKRRLKKKSLGENKPNKKRKCDCWMKVGECYCDIVKHVFYE